jgi:hypothetical protein
MPFDMTAVKGLFKNKWMVGGVAVAAAAGGFVLYKKSKSGASSTTGAGTVDPNAAGATTTPYGTGYMNTSGTDFATWVGQYSGSLQNQLDAFSKQQTDFLNGLAGTPASPTGGTTGGWPAPGSAGYQPKPTGSVAHVAQSGESWTTILNKYFANGGKPTTNEKALASWSALHGGSGTVTPGAKLEFPTSSPGMQA